MSFASQFLTDHLNQGVSDQGITLFGGMDAINKKACVPALSKQGHQIDHWHSIFPANFAKNLLPVDFVGCSDLLLRRPNLQNRFAATFMAPTKHLPNLLSKFLVGKARALSRSGTPQQPDNAITA